MIRLPRAIMAPLSGQEGQLGPRATRDAASRDYRCKGDPVKGSFFRAEDVAVRCVTSPETTAGCFTSRPPVSGSSQSPLRLVCGFEFPVEEPQPSRTTARGKALF